MGNINEKGTPSLKSVTKQEAWFNTPSLRRRPTDVLDHITDSLAQGDTVELRNFGILEVKLTKPRVGRNPNQPGSSFVIPARATVKFTSGKIMRQKVAKLSAVLKREAATK